MWVARSSCYCLGRNGEGRWKINWKMYFHSLLWFGSSKEITTTFILQHLKSIAADICVQRLVCTLPSAEVFLPLSPTEGKSWLGRFLTDASGIQTVSVTVTSPFSVSQNPFLGFFFRFELPLKQHLWFYNRICTPSHEVPDVEGHCSPSSHF